MKKYFLLIKTTTLGITFLFLSPSFVFAADNTWTTKTVMPTARTWPVAASVNNKVYIIGGASGGTFLTTNQEYDPVTNTWAIKASMPTGRTAAMGAVVNNKIYVLGGQSGSGPVVYSAANQEYNPVTNTWAVKANMPAALGYGVAAAVNNKVYYIGGNNGVAYQTTNYEYNPATNTWATKAPLSVYRVFGGAATVNDKIYVIGGQVSTGNTGLNEEYNPSTNIWTTKAVMPTARKWFYTSVANNKIYAIGGQAGFIPSFTTNEEYDPVTNTWITRAPMPVARGSGAAATVNNKIYAIGATTANEEYDPPFPNLIAGGVTPTAVYTNTPTTFSSTVSNIGFISTGAGFQNFFQVATAANGGGTITDLTPANMAVLAAGTNAAASSPSHTFLSPGTYSVRACSDKSNSGDLGVVVERNEGDNCGLWTNITVTIPNTAPVTPTVSGPVTTPTDTAQTYSFTATDPQNDQIRYGVDWDMNGVADVWVPAGLGYVNSGTQQSTTYSWATSGAKTFQVLAQDTWGLNSPWRTYNVTVTVPTCANGTNNYPTCTQCPDNQAYLLTNCVDCSGTGGCTGVPGGTVSNPNGSLVCNNSALTPAYCSDCAEGMYYTGSSCIVCSNGGCSGSGATLSCNNGTIDPPTCVTPAPPTCNSDNICGTGETFKNCSQDCSPNYFQF